MTEFNWYIDNMERQTSDGFVVTVGYTISATDGEYTCATTGTVNYKQSGSPLIPYEDLTQDIVIGWVQDLLGKKAVEDRLQNQIESQKRPATLPGLPWSQA
jgi:hypothetical protein